MDQLGLCTWIYVSVARGICLIQRRACGDCFWLCWCLCSCTLWHVACTWCFIGKLDCLIQCFIVLSLFTHAFGALQNTLGYFLWDRKMGAKLGFQGKNIRTGRGKVPVGPAVLQGNLGFGRIIVPSCCSVSILWWFYRGSPGRAAPPPESCSTKPHRLVQLSFSSV